MEGSGTVTRVLSLLLLPAACSDGPTDRVIESAMAYLAKAFGVDADEEQAAGDPVSGYPERSPGPASTSEPSDSAGSQ